MKRKGNKEKRTKKEINKRKGGGVTSCYYVTT